MLTKNEIKYMRLINSELNGVSSEKVEKILDILKKQNMFASDNENKFLQAIEQYKETGETRNTCIFCGKNLIEGYSLVCDDCLPGVSEEEPSYSFPIEEDVNDTEAVLSDTEDSPDNTIDTDGDTHSEETLFESAEENVTERKESIIARLNNFLKQVSRKDWIKLGIVVAAVIAVFVLAAVLVDHLHEKPARVLRRFNKYISETGYSLTDASVTTRESVEYEIRPTGDSFTIFNNAEGLFTGALLSIAGNDVVSRERQMFLMEALNHTVFKKISDEESEELISKVVDNKGFEQSDGYQIFMLINDDYIMYYVVDEAIIDKNMLEDIKSSLASTIETDTDNQEVSVAGEKTTQNSIEDGLMLLGQPLSVCDDLLGSWSPIVYENARYYDSMGVTVLYGSDNQIVNYVDCDGKGTNGLCPVCGITVGESVDDVIEFFKSQGMETELSDTDTITVFLSINGTDGQLDVYTDGKTVILVCASLLLK